MQLTLTKHIQQGLIEALRDPDFNPCFREEAQGAANASLEQVTGVSLALLKELSQFLSNRNKGSHFWFHEFLQGSSIYIEPAPEKVRSAELEKELERIRIEQENQQYARMVSSVVATEQQKSYFRLSPDIARETKNNLATIVNIGFSMVAVFVAIHMVSKTMLEDMGLRVLLSLAGAITIGVIESILYVKYTNAMAQPPPVTKKTKRNPEVHYLTQQTK